MLSEAIKSSEKAVELAKKYNNPNLSYFIEHAKKIKEHQKTNNEMQRPAQSGLILSRRGYSQTAIFHLSKVQTSAS
jgi:hypothetical protein